MFTVCQNPNLIIPLKNSTFGALERHHKVGSLGERSKKKKHRRLTMQEDSIFIGRATGSLST